MRVLDAFLATWSKARATFGEGNPQDGAAFDASVTLSQLQAEVDDAKPGDHWQGYGADAYAAANEKQARVLGESASLDRRLRAAVDHSAAVVAAGRRDLDAVRQWVVDAAATVPQTAQGERMLYPVISRGSREIVEILQRSHTDVNSVADRIRGISVAYQVLENELEWRTECGEETTAGPQ